MSEAIHVDVRFMSLAPDVGAAASADAVTGGAAGGLTVATDRWLRGEAHALSLRSPMGSGKSTFLDALIARLRSMDPGVTVLMVTYRQSLAQEHVNKLKAHGFVSYLGFSKDRKSDRDDLMDRAKHPRVICQVG
jgi:hypothetical protein